LGKKDKLPQSGRNNYLALIVPLLIIVVTLVIYNPSNKHGVLLGWDDTEYLNDPDVLESNLAGIFSNYHLGMYQPLPVFSMAINYNSAGLSPKAFHATNLFLHVINILLVWMLLFRLSRRSIVAGVGAFLFALHPMNVEPVAWISARSTLLFTAFYLGGLLTYIKYTEHKKPLYFVLTVLLALLSLFSKSLAMSFPFVLLVIDYYKGRQWNLKIWLEKVPFFVLSIIFGIVAIKAAQTFGHITDLAQNYSLVDRFFILCNTYVFYLVKLIVPINLSSIYSYPDMSGKALPILYYLSAIVPLALIYVVYRFWNKQKELIAGILFFSLTVAPVLPLFWSRIFVAADRYAYLSFIGLFLIIGVLIDRLLGRKLISLNYLKYGIVGVLVLYAIFLGYKTSKQIPFWNDTDILLSRAVYLTNSSPGKAQALYHRGNYYQSIAINKFDNAVETENLGMMKNSREYFRMSVNDYDATLAHNPDFMMAHAYRAISLTYVARFNPDYRENYLNMAMEAFDAAIRLAPDYADNYYNKAQGLLIAGDGEGACELFEKANALGSLLAGRALETYCKKGLKD